MWKLLRTIAGKIWGNNNCVNNKKKNNLNNVMMKLMCVRLQKNRKFHNRYLFFRDLCVIVFFSAYLIKWNSFPLTRHLICCSTFVMNGVFALLCSMCIVNAILFICFSCWIFLFLSFSLVMFDHAFAKWCTYWMNRSQNCHSLEKIQDI